MLSRFLNYFLEKHMLRWMHTSGSLCSFCVSFLLSLFFLFFFLFSRRKSFRFKFFFEEKGYRAFRFKIVSRSLLQT